MNKINLDAPVNTLFANAPVTTGTTEHTTTGNTMFAEAITNYAQIDNKLGGSGGSKSVDTSANYYGYYWNWWEPYNDYYYHQYHIVARSDRFEVAFKLARQLMDKKIVKPLKTIEDFFKLMDVIVGAL